MFFGGPLPGLQRHRAELREGPAVGPGDVGHVADRVDAGEAVDREVGGHVEAAAAALRRARRAAGEPAAWIPPAHTTVRVRISEPSESTTRSGHGLRHRQPRAELHAAAARAPCEAYSCALLGERRRARPGPGSMRWISARPTSRSWNRSSMTSLMSVGERAGRLHAGGAGTHDHEVERALVEQLSGCGRRPRTPSRMRERSRCGVVERVQREGVLLGARGVEVVRLATPWRGRGSRRRRCAVGAVTTVRVAGSTSVTSPSSRRPLVACGTCRAASARRRSRRPARSPPGRASAGTGGSCAVDQRDLHAVLGELLAQATPANPPPTTTTVVSEWCGLAAMGLQPGAAVHDPAVGEDRRGGEVAGAVARRGTPPRWRSRPARPSARAGWRRRASRAWPGRASSTC